MDDGNVIEHVMVSSGGGVQRLDVIASGAGRRRWTREAKARIIAESMAAGANVAEVARRNDMQPQHLYLWRRTALERMGSRMGSRLESRLESQMGSRTEPHDHPAFVPVAIEGPRLSPASQSVPDQKAGCPEISIDMCGVSLRIPDGASAGHIGRVLLAVRGTS